MTDHSGLCLGIDLGTTSVKVCLVDVLSKIPVFSTSEPTRADTHSTVGAKGSEQNVQKILNAVTACLNRITDKNRATVKCIAVSGQMHGVVLWNSDKQIYLGDNCITACSITNLYTWMDKRATDEYISTLPKPDSQQHLAAGFGCVTLFWLRQFEPAMFVEYNVAGSVMDYFVMLLCGLDRPVMSHQIATSWGYFDSDTKSWNSEILKDGNFPVQVLPVVVEAGAVAGSLCRDWFSIPKGTPVLAGLGDLQCSYLSAAKVGTDAVLNISTSCQLTHLVLLKGFTPPRLDTPAPVSYFPLLGDAYLAVAASLNGGNVLAAFVKMLLQWFSEFDIPITEETIWKKLTEISEKTSDLDEGLFILPVIFGERHLPSATGSVAGINSHNMSLRSTFRSLCEGLVSNIHQMLPGSTLIESGIKRLVVSGSVVDRQPYVLACVRKSYQLQEVVLGQSVDAAQGAALLGCRDLTQDTSDHTNLWPLVPKQGEEYS